MQGEARVKLRVLEANAASSQALYDTFIQRSKETQQQEGLQEPDGRVISRSAIPTFASFPNHLLVFAVAVFASLFTGFVVAFLLERLDHGFRTSARAENVLGYPVLSTLPDIVSSRSIVSPGGGRIQRERAPISLSNDRYRPTPRLFARCNWESRFPTSTTRPRWC